MSSPTSWLRAVLLLITVSRDAVTVSLMKLRVLWPEDCARAREVLGMTEDGIKRDVAALKDWLRKQPHLGPLIGVDEDQWLQNYLVMNKNSVERAKAALDEYFSVRWTLPDMFRDRDFGSPAMNRFFANTCLALMPGLTAEGHRVVVYSHFSEDATDFQHCLLVKMTMAVADVWLSEGADRVGYILVMDLRNTRLSHLSKYNLSLVRSSLDHGWKAYPSRVAAIHIVNPPPFMETALNLFRPFIKQKIMNRIQIHSKEETLKEHIPLTSLPSDYGGQAPSCHDMNKALQETLLERRALLDTVATHRSQEHLRPDSKKSTASWTDLGVDGTFRKLTLD